MSSLEFRIDQPNGRTEHVTLPAGRVLLGSGAHCDVRLPPPAQPEHMVVVAGPGTAHAQALSFEPPPLLNGAPFGEAPLVTGAVLTIGNARITVTMTEAVAPVVAPKKKTNPALIFAAAVSLSLAAYVLVRDDLGQRPLPSSTSDEPPPLWSGPPAHCPQADPGQAAAIGNERLALASSKRERRPFSAQDGVAAVPLFELAAVCLRLGNDPNGARMATDAAAKLRSEIQMDYRTHQVRLEHALTVEDYRFASREIDLLLALLEGKSGPYVTWLATMQRQLKMRPKT